jgi:DNA-binding NarL/FixJ family response regulator
MPCRRRADTLGEVVPSDSSPLRCLIVDDSANFLEAAGRVLEAAGISVVGVASTAADAVTRYTELRPDVTLVDVDLGADSGFDVVAELERADTPAPPTILISTHSENDFADLIAASPALGFLSKFALSPRAIRELLNRYSESR